MLLSGVARYRPVLLNSRGTRLAVSCNGFFRLAKGCVSLTHEIDEREKSRNALFPRSWVNDEA
jgi:hypothetical protein